MSSPINNSNFEDFDNDLYEFIDEQTFLSLMSEPLDFLKYCNSRIREKIQEVELNSLQSIQDSVNNEQIYHQLEQQNLQLNQQNSNLQENVTKLLSEITELELKLSNAKSTDENRFNLLHSELASTIEKLNNDIKTSLLTVDKKNSQINLLQKDLRDYEENYAKALEEKGTAVSQVNKLKSENLDISLLSQRLKNENENLKQINITLQSSISEKDANYFSSVNKLNQELLASRQEIANINARNSTIQSLYESSKLLNSEISEQLASMSESLRLVKEDLINEQSISKQTIFLKDSQISELKSRVEDLKAEVECTTQENTDLESSIKKLQNENIILQNEVVNLKSQTTLSLDNFEDKPAWLIEVTNKYEQKSKELQTEIEKRQELETYLQNLHEEIEQKTPLINKQIEDLRKSQMENQALMELLEQKTRDCEVRESEIKLHCYTISELQQKIDLVEKQNQSLRTSTQSNSTSSPSKNGVDISKYHMLQQENLSLLQKLKSINREKNNLEEQMNEKFKSAREQLENLKNEKALLNEKYLSAIQERDHFSSLINENILDTNSINEDVGKYEKYMKSKISKLKEQLQEAYKYQSQLSKERLTVENLTTQLSTLQSNHQHLERELTSRAQLLSFFESSANDKDSEILKLRNEVSSNILDLEQKKKQILSLQSENEQLKSTQSYLISEKSSYESDLKSSRSFLETMQLSLLESEERNKRYIDRLSNELKETNAILEESKKSSEELIEKHKTEIKECDLILRSRDLQVKELEIQVQKTKESESVLRNTCQQLEKQVNFLENQLSLANERINLLFAGKANADAKLSELLQSSETDSLRDEIANLKLLLDDYKKILSDKEADFQSLTEAFQKTRNDAQVSENEMNAIVAEHLQTISSLENQISGLNQRIVETNHDLTAQRDETKQINSQLENLRAIHSEAEKRNMELVSEIETLSRKWRDSEEKYQILLKNHSKECDDHFITRENLATQTNMASALTTQVGHLEELLKNKEKISSEQKKDLLNQIRDLSTHYAELEKQNTLLYKQIEYVNSRANRIEAQMKESNTALSNLENDASFTNTADDKNNELAVQQLHELIKFLQKEKESLKIKSDLASLESNRLKSELEQAKSTIDELRASLKQAQESHLSRLENETQENLEKLTGLSRLRESNSTLRADNNKLQNQLSEARAHIQSLEDRCAHLIAENSHFMKSIEILQSELSDQKNEIHRERLKVQQLESKKGSNAEEVHSLHEKNNELAQDAKKLKQKIETLEELVNQLKDENTLVNSKNNTLALKIDSLEQVKHKYDQLVKRLRERDAAKSSAKKNTEVVPPSDPQTTPLSPSNTSAPSTQAAETVQSSSADSSSQSNVNNANNNNNTNNNSEPTNNPPAIPPGLKRKAIDGDDQSTDSNEPQKKQKMDNSNDEEQRVISQIKNAAPKRGGHGGRGNHTRGV